MVFPHGKLPEVPMRPEAAAEFDRWLAADIDPVGEPDPDADPYAEPATEPERTWWRLVHRTFGSFVGTEHDDGRRLLDMTLDDVEHQRPASYVRIGDGEGVVLAPLADEYPALAEWCARDSSLRHFGDTEVLVDHWSELRAGMHDALQSADVIGVHHGLGVRALVSKPRAEIHPRASFGSWSAIEYLARNAAALDLGETVGTSAAFAKTLLPHFGELIEGRDIGLVACHTELPDALVHEMKARSVDFHAVPRQAILLRPEERGDTEHVPERYRELREALRAARPGIAYFVAAGMPAKGYCAVLKEAGAIAIDIGGTVDVWAGIRTRRRMTPEAVEQYKIVGRQ